MGSRSAVPAGRSEYDEPSEPYLLPPGTVTYWYAEHGQSYPVERAHVLAHFAAEHGIADRLGHPSAERNPYKHAHLGDIYTHSAQLPGAHSHPSA